MIWLINRWLAIVPIPRCRPDERIQLHQHCHGVGERVRRYRQTLLLARFTYDLQEYGISQRALVISLGVQFFWSILNTLTHTNQLEEIMNLSAPKNLTFYIAVVLAVIAFIGYFVGSFSAFAPWLMLIAFVVLAAGNLLEGL